MNITFDLETLGNNFNSPIVQIAAVKFTDQGVITDKFTRSIDIKSLEMYDFKCDYSTIIFWLEQSKEAIGSVFLNDKRTDILKSIYDFKEWIGKAEDYCYWSHATFDPVILRNACEKINLDEFIPFWLHCDIRTLTRLTGGVQIERKGNHHNALDDCIYQAEYISKCLQLIK